MKAVGVLGSLVLSVAWVMAAEQNFRWEDHQPRAAGEKPYHVRWQGEKEALPLYAEPDRSSQQVGVLNVKKGSLVSYTRGMRVTTAAGSATVRAKTKLDVRSFGARRHLSHADFWDESRGQRASIKLKKGDTLEFLDSMEGEEFGGRFARYYAFKGDVFVVPAHKSIEDSSSPTIETWSYHSTPNLSGWFLRDESQFSFYFGDPTIQH